MESGKGLLSFFLSLLNERKLNHDRMLMGMIQLRKKKYMMLKNEETMLA